MSFPATMAHFRPVASAPSTDQPAHGSTQVRDLSRELIKRIGQHKFDMWFAHADMRLSGQLLEVATDSAFVAKWIDSHFTRELSAAARDAVGQPVQVEVRVQPSPRHDDQQVLSSRDAELAPLAFDGQEHAARHGRDDRRHPAQIRPSAQQSRRSSTAARRGPILRRLDDFVVGPSNELAYAAAYRLAEGSDAIGMATVSPLFIHGECGVGKTHLLQGVCQRVIERTGRPQLVRYVTGEQFTNEYIAAVRAGTIDTFRQRIRKLDLLAIDDIHFLSNKVKTQSEFLYTLDSIAHSGARVVLASDEHPHHIKRFSQALVSRFMSGMVVKIDRPDRDMRIELLQRLAKARSLQLSAGALELIASSCLGSVRELEGAITKLAAYKLLLETGPTGLTSSTDGSGEIGLLLAQRVFKDQANQAGHVVRVGTIIECVCARLGVAKSDLMGSGRHRRIVLARSLVAHLAREMTTQSFPEIAQALGRANHSTIHTADQRLRRQLEANETMDLGAEGQVSLRELIDQLRHTILRAERS